MSYRLKKDIVIPAGTILNEAPGAVENFGEDHFIVDIGLTNNTCGGFTYCIDELEELNEWFEEV